MDSKTHCACCLTIIQSFMLCRYRPETTAEAHPRQAPLVNWRDLATSRATTESLRSIAENVERKSKILFVRPIEAEDSKITNSFLLSTYAGDN